MEKNSSPKKKGEKKGEKKCGRKYHKAWEKDFPWITKASDGSEYGYCKLCHCLLRPKKDSFIHHGKTKKHLKREHALMSDQPIGHVKSLIPVRKRDPWPLLEDDEAQPSEAMHHSACSYQPNSHVSATNTGRIKQTDEVQRPGQDPATEPAMIFVVPSPSFRHDALDTVIERGIIEWSQIKSVLQRGHIFVEQSKSQKTSRLLCMLIHGGPKVGTSALAAHLAKQGNFNAVKFLTPFDMIGLSETAKCLFMKKIFEDSSRSRLSCIILDDVDEMIGSSSVMLSAVRDLLKYTPPEDRKLLVMCTSQNHAALDGQLPARFSKKLEVPRIEDVYDIRLVLEQSKSMSLQEVDEVCSRIPVGSFRVGMKELLCMLDTMHVMGGSSEDRIVAFCNDLLPPQELYAPDEQY